MSSKLKMFVNNPDLWDSFLSELNERIRDKHKKLEQVVDPHEVYRAQGELQALRSLQKLRDKVNG